MRAVLDFMRGFVPWVIPAILLIIIAVKAAAKDKQDSASDEKHKA